MTINPHPNLIEHGKKLLEIPDLRGKLRYYNDNIYSLSFPYNRGFVNENNGGLHAYGEEDDGHGYGHIFFKRDVNTERSELVIYFEEREREIDRLKSLVSAETTYLDKLKVLVESRAGQKIGGHRFWREYLNVYSNEYENYYLFRKDSRSASPEVEEPIIDLWPRSKEDILAFNTYMLALFNEVRINPDMYHWLWKPSFKLFDKEAKTEEFKLELEYASSKQGTIKRKLRHIEQKYNLGSFSDYDRYIFDTDSHKWESSLFNAFYNGYNRREYDYSRTPLDVSKVATIEDVKNELKFYETIRDLPTSTCLADVMMNSAAMIDRFKKPKIKKSATKKQPVRGLSEICKEGAEDQLLTFLIKKGAVDKQTNSWISEKSGGKSIKWVIGVVKRAHSMKYFNKRPTAADLLNIANNTFNMCTTENTINKVIEALNCDLPEYNKDYKRHQRQDQ